MTFHSPNTGIKVLILSLTLFILFSCSKTDEVEVDIIGEYCTYRLGPTGHATSTMNVMPDTSERNDIIISNISGYNNTSEAFKNIGCDRLNNRLVIPESVALIGNSETMMINGEGQINSTGSITLEINTVTSTTENNFVLYLNNNASFSYFDGYTGTGQNLTILAEKIDLQFTTEDNEFLSFSILESENENCSIQVKRQSVIETASNESYLLEAEIYFGGDQVFGTVSYSDGGWQNAKSISLNLE